MKDKAGSTISSKQLIFLIIGSQIGIRLLYLPREITGIAQEDAWLAMLIATIVPIVSLFLIDRLGKRMPEMGFTQMSQALFGRFFGSILIILFIVYVIGFESVVVRIFSEVTKLYLLPRTPLVVIVFMFIFTVVYAGSKGARVIGRLNELLFYLLLVNFLVLMIPIGEADYTNLLPVGEAGWDGIGRGVLIAAQYYAGIEILLVFYSLVNRKDEILKAGIIATGITAVLYVVIVLICESVFGVAGMQHQLFPGLVLLKVVQIPVIERLEFIFLFFWMGMGARPAINMGFAASLSLTQLLKLDEKKYLPYLLMVIGLAMYILALLPPNLLTVFDMARYAGYGFYVIGIVYPLIYLIMAFARGGKVKQSA
ncbi:MAG: hypothetical protein CVU90_02540 [Firmicutes bacterium HGW-Firmicutes-15]|nr:MAG: hypothetical protein CVU90_02540 [Firmicutes bacterium HGW-Firmicutes-15]